MKLRLNNIWRKRMGNVALLFFSIVFSLLLAEYVVRIFFPQKLSFNISRWDEYVGFANTPSIDGYSETPEYKMYVKINSHGLRDREFDYKKPANTIRVGVFGDSFTFGEGVQQDETYAKVLENLCRQNPEIKNAGLQVEVLNFGIGKTGTSHQLALYLKEGMKYELDVVMVGFLSVNDFTDNWNGVFYLRNDSLVHSAASFSNIRKIQGRLNSIPFYKWASTHSHLVNLIKKSATLYDDKQRARKSTNQTAETKLADEKQTGIKQVDLTRKLLNRFKTEAAKNGSAFVVVNLPYKDNRLLLNAGAEKPAHLVLCDSLKGALKEDGIDLIDLVPVFLTLPAENYFFAKDGHMNVKGNAVLGEAIYKYQLPGILRSVAGVKMKSRALVVSE